MISKKQSKFIKSLKIKKYRIQENAFIIEGRKNVLELINSDYHIKHLLATPDFINEFGTKESVREIELIEVTSQQLQELGTFKTNNDCLAVAEMKTYTEQDFDSKKHFIALDGVSDPGNLGTIIRTMDWFGFDQLICSPQTAEVYNPKVVNSTMGSFTRVKFLYTDLVSFIKYHKLSAFGADLNGAPLGQWKPERPSVIVMGSESHGLSDDVTSHVDGKISIPRVGGAESLNVAIATGIICHHLRS